MTETEEPRPAPEGHRERKRRETARRIADAGLRLFIANGYEATTLDAIAAEAGISRRTFFYYFKSKDDILLSMVGSFDELIAEAFRDEPSTKKPIDATRDALIRVCARYPAEEMTVIDRIMRSSPAVQARKQATYIQQEETLFRLLRERWPAPQRKDALRLVAMTAVGAMRVSLETLYREEGKRPLPDLVRAAFEALEAEI